MGLGRIGEYSIRSAWKRDSLHRRIGHKRPHLTIDDMDIRLE